MQSDTYSLEIIHRGSGVTRFRASCVGYAIGHCHRADFHFGTGQGVTDFWLIRRECGSVFAYRFADGSRKERHHVPIDLEFYLYADLSVRRIKALPQSSRGRGNRGVVRVGSRKLVLDDRPALVGTDPCCDLVLFDDRVAARHLLIEPVELNGGLEGCCLRDLGSREGTMVKGLHVDRAWVPMGTSVRIGQTDLLLEQETSASSSRAWVVHSSEMKMVADQVRKYADASWPALILGETGVGKELIAHQLHALSNRSKQRFVALNAGAFPADLIESELFGHERGAFTGAIAPRKGAFELAHRGTLFLDEIGELPFSLQTRLLRVLETGKIRRVGSDHEAYVDVRVVCATHRDLKQCVQAGTFREDLFFRLCRLMVEVPALRNRTTDIEPLAKHFLKEIANEVGLKKLRSEALAQLMTHAWPGNARELKNVLSLAAIESPSVWIELSDIQHAMSRSATTMSDLSLRPNLHQGMHQVVGLYGGNISQAARALGIPRTTLRDRLRNAAP